MKKTQSWSRFFFLGACQSFCEGELKKNMRPGFKRKKKKERKNSFF